jgi:predicted ester cyclase
MTEQQNAHEGQGRQRNEQLVGGFRALAMSGEFRPMDELFPPNLEDLFLEDYVQEEPHMEGGIPGVRSFIGTLKTAFPDDLVGRVDYVVYDREDEKVVVTMTWEGTHRGEFMGIAPTGKRVGYQRIEVWRLEDGKFAEHWGHFDFYALYGLLRELGAVPEVRPA